MSGLAEILLNLGFKVSGSDLNLNHACKRLAQLGAQIAAGHSAQNLPEGTSLLVYSSAVHPQNAEILEARSRGLPVVRRAEILAELMRLKYGIAVAGSHGKTSTTSMIAAVLEAGKIDPTVIIGGQVRSLGSGSKLGRGEFLVAETDESDRSFLLLKPTIAVVTNIDAEHLSAYSSLAELEQAFEAFVAEVPFYGLAVLCIDDQRVRDLAERYRGRKMTFGVSPDAQFRACNLKASPAGTSYDLVSNTENLGRIELPMLGSHMAVNSLAACALGFELNIPFETIQNALGSFSGIKRRLEILGEAQGVCVINDYAHHPAEVRASISAVRDAWGSELGRLFVLFQPHRFSRTRDCFAEFVSCFNGADCLLLSEIYPASEAPIEGISGQALFEASTHDNKYFIADVEAMSDFILPKLQPKDVVLCLGAGPIGAIAENLFAGLKEERRCIANS